MMIQLKGINKTYFNGAPLHVLKGIDLDIEKGEMVSIMGASREVNPIEYLGDIGYVRHGHLSIKRTVDSESKRKPCRRAEEPYDRLHLPII